MMINFTDSAVLNTSMNTRETGDILTSFKNNIKGKLGPETLVKVSHVNFSTFF